MPRPALQTCFFFHRDSKLLRNFCYIYATMAAGVAYYTATFIAIDSCGLHMILELIPNARLLRTLRIENFSLLNAPPENQERLMRLSGSLQPG